MPFQELTQALPHHRRFHRLVERHVERQMVRSGGRVHLMEEPEPLLRERQRDQFPRAGPTDDGELGRFEAPLAEEAEQEFPLGVDRGHG